MLNNIPIPDFSCQLLFLNGWCDCLWLLCRCAVVYTGGSGFVECVEKNLHFSINRDYYGSCAKLNFVTVMKLRMK